MKDNDVLVFGDRKLANIEHRDVKMAVVIGTLDQIRRGIFLVSSSKQPTILQKQIYHVIILLLPRKFEI